MSPEELENCARFKALKESVNEELRLKGQKRGITTGKLAKLSNNTISRENWSAMINGHRRLTEAAKMYAAIALRMRPQDIWPTWQWSLLTRVAPDARIRLADAALSGFPEHERTEWLLFLDRFNRSSKTRRREILRTLRTLTGDEESGETPSATSEAG